MNYRYVDENRIGDHICYYSDLRKMKAHYPAWDITQKPAAYFRGDRRQLDERGSQQPRGYRLKLLITGICGFVGSSLAAGSAGTSRRALDLAGSTT